MKVVGFSSWLFEQRLQSASCDSAGRGTAPAARAWGAAHSQDPQAGCKIKQKGILILYVNKTMQIGETNKPRNITR